MGRRVLRLADISYWFGALPGHKGERWFVLARNTDTGEREVIPANDIEWQGRIVPPPLAQTAYG